MTKMSNRSGPHETTEVFPISVVQTEHACSLLSAKRWTVPKETPSSCHAHVSPPSSLPSVHPEPTEGSVTASRISWEVTLCQLWIGWFWPHPPAAGYGQSA